MFNSTNRKNRTRKHTSDEELNEESNIAVSLHKFNDSGSNNNSENPFVEVSSKHRRIHDNSNCIASSDDVITIKSMMNSFDSLSLPSSFQALHDLISEHCSHSHLQYIHSIVAKLTRKDFIKHLPLDVGMKIFSFLLPHELLLRISTVSKRWNDILFTEWFLWKELASGRLTNTDYFSGKEQDLLSVQNIISPTELSNDLPLLDDTKKLLSNYYISILKRIKALQSSWKSGLNTTSFSLECHPHAVITCLQILEKEDRIIAGSEDTNVTVWKASSGTLLRTISGHLGGVWALEAMTVEDCVPLSRFFRNPQKVLVTGSTDRTLRVWDYETGNCRLVLAGHSSTVRCLKICTDHLKVVSGSRDHSVRIWDLISGNCLFVLLGHTDSVRCLVLNEKWLFTGSYDQTIKKWNINSGKLIKTLNGHKSKVYTLELIQAKTEKPEKESLLVSGSTDHTGALWDTDSGNLIGLLQGHTNIIGMLNVIESNKSMKNGYYVATASTDSTIRLWKICKSNTNNNGVDYSINCISRLIEHKSPITCITSTHDWIVSGSDRSLKLFYLKRTNDKDGIELIEPYFVRDLISDVDIVWRVCSSPRMVVVACQTEGQTHLRLTHFNGIENTIVC